MRRLLLAVSLLLPVPAVAAPYEPQDSDERGLWMQMNEVERKLQTSEFVIRDPELNAYVRGVLCRSVGEDECGAARIYIMRTPYFNASMAPNGMMQVWSGLLLRMENEAQLASVLGHEFAHYKEQHSLRLFRDIRGKTNAAAWLGFIPFGFVAQLGIGMSMFSFNREMERDADAKSIDYLVKGGYDPAAATRIWSRLRDEMDATAAERKTKSRKDKNGGIFATHPPSAERVDTLKALAAAQTGTARDLGTERYRAALAPFWADFFDDQAKLNDFGASEFLLKQLAESGWTAELLFARGELHRRRAQAGDFGTATGFYRDAIAAGGEMPAIWRGLGLSLMRSGDADAGRAELREYLRRAPDASDRAMITTLAGESK
ncbi:MAG TPA: M48 family metalloprotease [Sphingopyxis sp.]|nr:M48 family metalloprotease [Sphingopyxis sp.]HMP46119.1 M48 family metalloprotease [Sphingopyxis sp.]HMQ19440.1 M48 family metalloprotease [Sphingopyxis sp.]